MSPQKIRMRGRDHEILKELRGREDIREMAVEEGIIDEEEVLTNEDILKLALSHNPDPYTRPEEEMVWTHAGDAKPEIMKLAGKNVSVHEVINRIMDNMIDERNIEVHHD